MRKALVCGFALLASLAWSQEASMKVSKGSVEQDGNITFSVRVQPAPSVRSSIQVVALPVNGGNGYKSICLVEANADSCDVKMHIPPDAATGTYRVAAINVAPMSGVYKKLAVNGQALTFDVTKSSVTLPSSADVAIKQ
jgi:hypothetical protein